MASSPGVIVLEIVDRLIKRWGLLIAVLCFAGAGAIVALRYLPKTYEARTSIFVAPSQLGQDIVRSRGVDDISTRLAALRESVVSRPYLSKVVTEIYGVAADSPDAERDIAAIRAGMVAEVAHYDRERGSGLFSLSFRDSDPLRCAKVVNRLAELFIEANAHARAAQADTNVRVLESLAAELAAQMKEHEDRIVAFQSANLFTLGNQSETNLRLLDSRTRDAEANERSIADVENRRAVLVAQRALLRAGAGSTVNPSTGQVQGGLEAQLAAAKADLDRLEQQYTPAHPLVQARRRQVEDLEAKVRAQAAVPEGDATASARAPAAAPSTIETEIENMDRELARLRANGERIRREMDQYRGRIEASPRVAQEYAELTKGYDVMKERYQDYQRGIERARAMTRVEEVRQGEQFEILERAIAPSSPIRPNPPFVLLGALCVSFALCVGPLLLKWIVAPDVYSRAALGAIEDVPVLATVPMLGTGTARRVRRRRRLANVGISIASAGLLAATIWAIVLRGV